MADTTKLPVTNGRTAMELVRFVLPLVIAIVGAYGTVRYTEGETQQTIRDLQRQVQSNKAEIDKMRENQVTKSEMRQFMESTSDVWNDIKTDLREMRRAR